MGGAGFPRLSDDILLWGGLAEDVVTTLHCGINSPHPDARYAKMKPLTVTSC
jgi:cytochrome c oxidase cbb3-type subunit 3